MIDDYDDFDLEELRQLRHARRAYEDALARHPDPRDPDYPGLEGEE